MKEQGAEMRENEGEEEERRMKIEEGEVSGEGEVK